MNYYDVSFESDTVFCSNIVKAAKESDIRAYYEADGYRCNSIRPVSEERAMESIKYHPGKPIIEIPEIKEETHSGTDLKILALRKNIVKELNQIGIQTVEELEERILEVEKKFPPDWFKKIKQALEIQHNIESKKEADVDLVPDFPEPLEAVVMPDEYALARQADELVNNGMKLAQIGVSQMCRGVKMMHDGKLYKQFGFQNFAEYCKSKGFSREHGTRLVKISEMLEQENVTPGSHFEKLGLTVLKLLAPLEPEQREQLAQTVDLETISNRQIYSGHIVAAGRTVQQ